MHVSMVDYELFTIRDCFGWRKLEKAIEIWEWEITKIDANQPTCNGSSGLVSIYFSVYIYFLPSVSTHRKKRASYIDDERRGLMNTLASP